MNERRVVVTGMGVIGPMGNTTNEYWKNLVEGKSGISKLSKFDPSELPSQVGGEVKNFDPKDYMDFKASRRMDIFTHYGVAASGLAIEDAGLNSSVKEKLDRTKIGVNIGSGIGGIPTFTDNLRKFDESGWKKVSPFFIPMLITNICSGYVTMMHNFHGPSYSISSACATSNHTISEAYYTIKNKNANIMITGGTEGALIPFAIAGFCAARALSTKKNDEPERASRPFDKDRDGFVMSEGAAIIVLEELEHALSRGSRIHAELIGVGMSSDAYHLTDPHPDGLGAQLSMNNAINSANLQTKDIKYLNAHGTSTIVGDIAEVKAIKKVFGEHAYNLKINSTKSLLGHLLGAAGCIEAIAVIEQLKHQKIHPTINLENPEDGCDLDFVPNKAIDYNFDVAMSNSFGFGGHNCSLIFKKYE